MPERTDVTLFLVARHFPPHVGGVERQVYLLAEAFAARGAPVDVWTSTVSPLVPPGVREVRSGPRWGRWMPLYLLWLAASLTAARVRNWNRPVVVVVTRVSAESAAICALRIVTRWRPVVFLTGGDEHGSEWTTQRRPWVRWLLLRGSAAIVAQSRPLLDDIKRSGFGRLTAVIPTIVPGTGGPPCLWARHGSSRRLIWCGRDDPVKNLPALARLFKGALQDFSDAPALLVCEREPSVPFQSATVHVGCPSPRSHWRPGDVMVVTSFYEGQSNAVAEAALEGVPTVAYDTGGTGDLLEALDGGEVVPLDAPDEDFAAAVSRVAARFTRPVEQVRLAGAARQRFAVGAVHDWVSVISRVVAARRDETQFAGDERR